MLKTLIVLISLVSLASFSSTKTSISLTNRIKKHIRKSKLPEKSLGIYVSFLGGQGESLVDINGEKMFIPASLTKIATAATVFNKINLKTKFMTRLASLRKPYKKILNGDLYLVGGGDPSFTSEHMWNLVNEFVRLGIREIKGDILVDDSFFDRERFPKSRSNLRVDRAYDAPIGAMSFNWNVGNIYIRPSQIGKKAKVYIDPYNGYYKIKNKTRTVSGKRNHIKVFSSKLKNPKGSQRELLLVSGTIGQQRKEARFYKKITEPDYWSGYNLKWFLASRGVKHKGSVLASKLPKKYITLAKVENISLAYSVQQLMKYSNNLIAETLTKHLALAAKTEPTEEMGIRVISKYLSSIGLKEGEDFKIFSSSGFSRLNQFKPKSFFKIIESLSKDFRIYPEFLASLPIAGIDGTLRERMQKNLAKGWLRAKTGRLNGVLGLSGVVLKHKPIAFTFIFNGDKKQSSKAEELFNKLASEITRFKFKKLK